MGSQGAIIFLVATAALAVVAWGAFRSRRSIVVAVIALIVGLLAAGCNWYSYAESQSVPWATGYGVVALLSASVVMKHIRGKRDE
jgi:hypothetical protein